MNNAIATRNESFFQQRGSGAVNGQQQIILAAIEASNRKYGRHDHTLREICAITRLEINTVSGRVNELKKAGLLIEAAPRKCRVTGRTVTPVEVAA